MVVPSCENPRNCLWVPSEPTAADCHAAMEIRYAVNAAPSGVDELLTLTSAQFRKDDLLSFAATATSGYFSSLIVPKRVWVELSQDELAELETLMCVIQARIFLDVLLLDYHIDQWERQAFGVHHEMQGLASGLLGWWMPLARTNDYQPAVVAEAQSNKAPMITPVPELVRTVAKVLSFWSFSSESLSALLSTESAMELKQWIMECWQFVIDVRKVRACTKFNVLNSLGQIQQRCKGIEKFFTGKMHATLRLKGFSTRLRAWDNQLNTKFWLTLSQWLVSALSEYVKHGDLDRPVHVTLAEGGALENPRLSLTVANARRKPGQKPPAWLSSDKAGQETRMLGAPFHKGNDLRQYLATELNARQRPMPSRPRSSMYVISIDIPLRQETHKT